MSEASEILKTIMVPINVTRQNVEDILITAFDGSYGGSWYWIENLQRVPNVPGDPTPMSTWDCVLNGGTVLIKAEDDDNKARTLNLDLFLHGLKLWVEKWGTDRSIVDEDGIDAGQIDASDADAIVQLAVFGEVVYG